VHDQIALGDFCRLGNELIGPLAPARRPADALAQQILLADHGEFLGDKAALDRQRNQADNPGLDALRLLPMLGRFGPNPMLAQQMRQPLARPVRPRGNQRALMVFRPGLDLR